MPHANSTEYKGAAGTLYLDEGATKAKAYANIVTIPFEYLGRFEEHSTTVEAIAEDGSTVNVPFTVAAHYRFELLIDPEFYPSSGALNNSVERVAQKYEQTRKGLIAVPADYDPLFRSKMYYDYYLKGARQEEWGRFLESLDKNEGRKTWDILSDGHGHYAGPYQAVTYNSYTGPRSYLYVQLMVFEEKAAKLFALRFGDD